MAGVSDHERFRQSGSYEVDDRGFVAVKYEPSFLKSDSARTTITANYEWGDTDSNRPRSRPPEDRLTPWWNSYTTPGGHTFPAQLTADQMRWKDRLGTYYGELVHEARAFDPIVHDIEAFLRSSQRFVTGTVTVRLVRGRIEIVKVQTDATLMGRLGAVYGEESAAWTGEEARAFAHLYGMPSILAAARDREVEGTD